MKTALQTITELSAILTAGQSKIDQHRADILRATAATLEAGKLIDELALISRKRAELKAVAFVAKAVADTTDLDKQEKTLERASRQAVEDGLAAEIAIGMLEEQINTTQAELNEVTGLRQQTVVAWLLDRREQAIKRYIAVLAEIGQPVGEAKGIDTLLSALGIHDGVGHWIWKQLRHDGLPVPFGNMVERANHPGTSPVYDLPFTWLRDNELGATEATKMLETLRGAGLELAIE
ncbi:MULTISPECIES: hypothetical protein [unclassified Pseudomonas]|uniref:hypothetical protein n=1 Tax=unclassified Pseudomonas TaxID=196821 RepID=UPI002B23D3A2|nr:MULTISPECIES: hypothetical protein [unclassified Pseudomonas]MEA9997205.1 hypothetical protein [Pseudomonas sp. AA4]MEB0088394.1 hypothetical protein [Pseudomonas sp. RTI1]MEB0128180.1 hypothetical protein [Pseudomonas sp. CCC1.2]MEB0155497.1 hypothetical protein [Pseudomonas sp. CCC4.3]MEB0221093.1 hypothetical protein [Pseudomonas sp. AB12(2023)]